MAQYGKRLNLYLQFTNMKASMISGTMTARITGIAAVRSLRRLLLRKMPSLARYYITQL